MPPEVFKEFLKCNSGLVPVLYTVMEHRFFCLGHKGSKKKKNIKVLLKGQIISKGFFLAEHSSKKRTKTRRIPVKTNSFVRFLEESMA